MTSSELTSLLEQASLRPDIHPLLRRALRIFLGQHPIKIRSLSDRERSGVHASELRANLIYKVLSSFFNLRFEWSRSLPVFDSETLINIQTLNTYIEKLLSELKPLYQIADDILDHEVPGINSHDQSHIRRVLNHIFELFQISQPLELTQDALEILAIAQLSAVFHDLAQSISGRVGHETVAARLFEMAASTDRSFISQEMQRVTSSVARNVEQHTTRNFDFARIKQGRSQQEIMAYALLVLADESDITNTRTTVTGLDLFLDPLNNPAIDQWFYLNRFTKQSIWKVTDQGPEWCLFTSIGETSARTEYQLRSERLEGKKKSKGKKKSQVRDVFKGVPGHIDLEMITVYRQYFYANVLNSKKSNLFKSLCRQLFGITQFSVCFVYVEADEDGTLIQREVRDFVY